MQPTSAPPAPSAPASLLPPTLHAETPEVGYQLAVRLARLAVKLTQPDADIRAALRPAYDRDAGQLIAISQVVATHFQTVAAANGYWRAAAGAP
jgi:hypothetical protein